MDELNHPGRLLFPTISGFVGHDAWGGSNEYKYAGSMSHDVVLPRPSPNQGLMHHHHLYVRWLFLSVVIQYGHYRYLGERNQTARSQLFSWK